MAVSLQIEFNAKDAPNLGRLAGVLKGGEREKLFAQIAGNEERIFRDHLAALSRSPKHHRTAAKLGASPTGFHAANAGAVSARARGASVRVEIGAPGYSRAFGTLKIRPRRAKMLTIPMRAEAYGKRAREFDDLFVMRTKKKNLVLARRAGKGKLQFLYALVKSADIPQDRTILPSDQAIAQVAELAARDYIDALL